MNNRPPRPPASTVTQHGFWVRYVPDPFPPDLPPNTLFVRRESDGMDWYDFVRANQFDPDSVWMNVSQDQASHKWIIRTAQPDIDMLVPNSSLVIEVTGVDKSDHQALIDAFSGREFDPDTNAIGEVPLPPHATLSRRQFFQIGAMKGFITYEEALAAVQHGAIPAMIEEYIKTLPIDQEFAARMLIAGASEFDRHHPLVESMGQFMGLTDAQLDAFWKEGADL